VWCGVADSYRPRYATGGGWRVVAYVCDGCGRRVRPRSDRADRTGGS
jgi:hypothetical protein